MSSWPLELASLRPGVSGWVDRLLGRRDIGGNVRVSEKVRLAGEVGDVM